MNHPKEVRALKIARQLRSDGHPGIGDPLRVFMLPLSELNTFLTIKDFGDTLPVFGVCAGDWDLKGRALERLPLYRMCEEHFGAGVPWPETQGFRDFSRLRPGNSRDRNLNPEYLKYLDSVFDQIRTHGYRTQSELRHHRDFLGARASPLNEIQVFVGRDGQCMVKLGLHRTILAKLQKLDSIPVRTRVRHTEWQAIRDELCRSGGTAVSERAKRHLAHPELQDVWPVGPS